jgi:N-acetylneuraminic acid mutarotase
MSLQMVHTKITDFPGVAVGGTVPKFTESIVQDCKDGINNFHEVRPKKFETWTEELAAQYNLFINCTGRALKWNVPTFTSQLGAWLTKPDSPEAIDFSYPVYWNDRIYYFGGSQSAPHDFMQFFDLNTQQWVKLATPGTAPSGRYGHFSAVVGSKMYIIGGQDSGGFFNETWEYDLPTNTYVAKANMTDPRSWMFGVLRSGIIYIYGGWGGLTNNTVYTYNTGTNVWGTYATAAPPWRSHSTSAFDISGDKWYIVGGWDGVLLDEVWEHDFTGNSWTQKADYFDDLMHIATTFYDSKLWAFGGGEGTGIGNTNDQIWLFDPGTNSWTFYGNTLATDTGGRAITIGANIFLQTGFYNPNDFNQFNAYEPIVSRLGAIAHNTFYNCEEDFDFTDYRKDYGWNNYETEILDYYYFIDNLTYLNNILFPSKLW